MITRIEIDGFKSFVDFELDVPQLLVLVGANNGGKSNLLEAVELYRDLQLGGASLAFLRRERGHAIFHRDVRGHERYEFCIAVTADGSQVPVRCIRAARDARDAFRTVFPGEERHHAVSGWLWIDLSPAEMRYGADSGPGIELAQNGHDVAAVVAGMARDREEGGAFSRLLMDLAAVVPGFADLVPVYDDRRRAWDLDFVFDTGRRLPCSMASDGTLRVLGVLTALHSTAPIGTLLVDEIEMGLHPAFLVSLVERMQRRLDDSPGLQVIMTTHSPVVVSRVLADRPESVVFFDQVYGALSWPDGSTSPTERTRARHVSASGEPGHYVTPREVRRYLETVRPLDLTTALKELNFR